MKYGGATSFVDGGAHCHLASKFVNVFVAYRIASSFPAQLEAGVLSGRMHLDESFPRIERSSFGYPSSLERAVDRICDCIFRRSVIGFVPCV